MENKFDIITIGDSTVDTFIKIHDATVECDINHEECKICIAYGDKIPVDSIGHEVAGNAANVALGCAKLDLKTAIYTNLGDDQAGYSIKQAFEDTGVSTQFVKVNQDKESNLSVVLTFSGERTIFVYHQPWYYSLPALGETSWIYLTSMAESFTSSNIMDEICHYIKKSHSKLAFAPGTYQLKADVKRYPKVLEKSNLLIVNLEEAKKILNINIKETVDVKTLLAKLLLLGPKIAVITDGTEGSYATDGQRNLRLGIFPTQLVEKTGAGDAYSSGFLTALILGKPVEEAMVWGTVNAAKVIGRIGPQKGLLSKAELANYLKAASGLVATPF